MFIATELMRGGDLYTALRRHPETMAWDRLGRKVALDVALGLNYLHSQVLRRPHEWQGWSAWAPQSAASTACCLRLGCHGDRGADASVRRHCAPPARARPAAHAPHRSARP